MSITSNVKTLNLLNITNVKNEYFSRFLYLFLLIPFNDRTIEHLFKFQLINLKRKQFLWIQNLDSY